MSAAILKRFRQGKTSSTISNNDGVEGIIALTEKLKPESKEIVRELTCLSVETVMLTGYSRALAEKVTRAVGILGSTRQDVI